MIRRPLLVTLGWLAAAGLAVLVGLGAISVIGSGLMSSAAGQPRTEAEVARELAAQPSALPTAAPSELPSDAGPSGPTPSRSSSTASATPVTRPFATRGGTVVAQCVPGGARIVSMSPAQGFAVHEQTGGARAEAEGEFRGTSDNHDRVKVTVLCAGGRPDLTTRNG